jgi:hypothetical protein
VFENMSFLSDEEAAFDGGTFKSVLEGLVKEVEAVSGSKQDTEKDENYYNEEEEEDYSAYEGQYGNGNFKIVSKKPKKPKTKKVNGS